MQRRVPPMLRLHGGGIVPAKYIYHMNNWTYRQSDALTGPSLVLFDMLELDIRNIYGQVGCQLKDISHFEVDNSYAFE